MTKVSAPGKVHLIGEHAVVYGEPAIFAAVGLRTSVAAEKSGKVVYRHAGLDHNDSWSIDEVMSATEDMLRLWNTCAAKGNFSELLLKTKENRYENYRKAAVGIALKNLRIGEGISLEIQSQLPAGAGLGSSASLAVAAVQAIALEYGKAVSKEKINSIAFETEKLIHGNPSGGDNSACCFGGLIWFQRPSTIMSLKEKIPYRLENFVLAYTKKPEKSTGELVQGVRNLDESCRNPRIREIGRLADEMRGVLENRDFSRMKEIINRNQQLLAGLGVSTKEIDELHEAVKEIGGAAKLCGGGGGGIVLCYHEDKEKLKKTIESFGYESIEAELAVEGVKTE